MAKKKSKVRLRPILLLLLTSLIAIAVIAIGYSKTFGSSAKNKKKCSRLERLFESCDTWVTKGAAGSPMGILDVPSGESLPTVGKNSICRLNGILEAHCQKGLQCKGSPKGKCK